jgi:leucyl aminopeptidase
MATVDDGVSTYQLLDLARSLISEQVKLRASRIGVVIYRIAEELAERCAEALVAATLAADAELPSRKSKAKEEVELQRLDIHGVRVGHGYKRSIAEAGGNNLARELSILPPNDLTPGIYLKRLRKLAKERGWAISVLDEAALMRKGAGAFLAVCQGSPTRDACIVKLSYRPVRAKRHIALVGKGICYDTGGVNLKPSRYMLGMHKDMEGSAVALGVLWTLTQLGTPIAADCWLALAMNHIGPKSYKPNDVVVALDGTSIEVIHSDAEGRMVLSDTLAMAARARPRPDLLLDYATLTGSCVGALGKRYSGVFTNRPDEIDVLIAAGKASGERVWPFPMDPDYDDALKSDIADVKQCAAEGNADHILAARFLKRFVPDDIPWVHMDLSSGSHTGGLAHIPTDITGFGVRYSMNLLLDQDFAGQ